MPFPPSPTYPKAYDTDYTLFLVYNTTETKTCVENIAWSQEVEIIPVAEDKDDIWADNGFANINGELFYYDSVDRNENDKVYKLKGCARNLGGDHTTYNPKGTWVRSYVVAEHHNQMVDAILKTQNFIGFNFDPRQETLDWRIRNLQELEVIFDDYACPDINFTFNVVENHPVRGILATFLVEITPPGIINNYRLDFGDGNFTTTDFSGEHRYPLNARIDPVVTVTNDKCQMIITPSERSNPAEPPPLVNQTFEIPIPESPDIPDFTFVPCDVGEPNINIPPLVVPCISLEGQIGPIPSVIEGPDFPSQIVILGPENPVQILHSVVTITSDFDIPSIILIEPPIPPTIVIDTDIPSEITVVTPSSIMLQLDQSQPLMPLQIDWGSMPPMEMQLTLGKRLKPASSFADEEKLREEFPEMANLFEAQDFSKIEYEEIGIPSEIQIVATNLPNMKFDTEGLERIKLQFAEIPAIKIDAPESIRLEGPQSIGLVFEGGAIPVNINTEVTVKIEPNNAIPEKITVEMPNPIPDKITIEGMPDKLVLEGPKFIELRMPEKFADGIPLIMPDKPEVELVYRGAPIEVKITMDEILTQSDKKNCVMIVPCGN